MTRRFIALGTATILSVCCVVSASSSSAQGTPRGDTYYGQYSFVHTVNNAAVVAASLLWGEGDYTRTVGLAVQGGWDTDCNGATAGSVFGAMHGTKALPGNWVEPLNDLVRSAVFGFDNSRISDLAERTLKLALENTASL